MHAHSQIMIHFVAKGYVTTLGTKCMLVSAVALVGRVQID